MKTLQSDRGRAWFSRRTLTRLRTWAALIGVFLGPGTLVAGARAPVARIVAPVDGAVVMSTNRLVVVAEASDPDGQVARVALFREGRFLAQSTTAPHRFELVSPGTGAQVFTVAATDDQGNTTVSLPVTVIVEDPLPPYFPPLVGLSLAGSGTNLVLTAPAAVTLTATATVYRDGLDRFDFQAVYEPLGPGPVVAGEGRLNPSTVTFRDLAVGRYEFSVIARDIYGGEATSVGVVVTVLPPAGLVVPWFRLDDLGVLGGDESGALAINHAGAVVGTSSVAAPAGERRAFLWLGGVMRDVPHPEGSSYGLGLNDLGEVSGGLVLGGRLAGAFVWTPSRGLMALPVDGSQAEAFALNRHGQAVGWTGDATRRRPALWTFGGVSDPVPALELRVLSASGFGQARAINDAGWIAGHLSAGEHEPSHAVLWRDGGEVDLGVNAGLGAEASQALGINASGVVVGQVSLTPPVRRGFVWEDGEVFELMPLIGSSGWPAAINDLGWSVGSSRPDRSFTIPEHAVLWIGRTPFDLNTLVTNLGDAVVLSASAVNQHGEIVGTALIGGRRHACRLTPTGMTRDHVAPTVELAGPAPAARAVVGEPVALLASAQAGTAPIARVEFVAGHSVVATAHASPYTAAWLPSAAGGICVRAVAIDATGHASASSASCITVEPAPPRYMLADLGALNDLEARGRGMNAAGEFVGQARNDRGEAGFVFRGGNLTFLQPPGPEAGEAWDINDSGQVLVWNNGRAGILQGNAIDWLPALPAGTPQNLGRAINNHGQVAGESRTDQNETRAALFSAGTVTDLGSTLGQHSQAQAINDSGVVVGWSQAAPGQPVLSFIHTPGAELRQFGSQLGGTGAQATGIDPDGVVIGNAADDQDRQRAFAFANGIMRDLGTLGGAHSFARDINAAGQVVGSSDDPFSNRRAFLHEQGMMIDLNALMSATNLAVLTEAVAINDRGQILANGIRSPSDTAPRVFLLNPLPPPSRSNEPPSVVLLAPADAPYHDGDPVVLTASASDADGAVAMVQFSAGSQVLGSVARPPYSLVWSNVPAGTHTLSATAFDHLGAVRTSAPVSLTVRSFNPAAPAVAILGNAPDAHHGDVRRNLRRTELFSRVDILGLPTSGTELDAYDAVFVHSQGGGPLPATLGDQLADRLDRGRGVVVALEAADVPRGIAGGRLVAQGYLPWTNGPVSSHGRIRMVADLPDHPLLAGVGRFDGGAGAVYADELVLAPGSTRVASWETGPPLAVVREVGAGRVVGLNLVPVSGAVSGLGWDPGSGGARLLGNALLWTALGSAGSLQLTNATGAQAFHLPGEPVNLLVRGTNVPSDGVVRFYADGVLLGSTSGVPAAFSWTNAPVGNHLLVATHTDAGGRVMASPGLPVLVDSRFSARLVSPADGSVFYLPTNILMRVALTNLDAAVVRVDYQLDRDQRLASVTTPPFDFDFTLLPVGTFALSAIATDALGARRITPAHTVTIIDSAAPQRTVWTATDGTWPTATNWTAGPPRPQDHAVVERGTVVIPGPVASASSVAVGGSGDATLVLTGGVLTVQTQIRFGEGTGALGRLVLQEPAAVTAQTIVLGLNGTGRLEHHGGSVDAGQLILSGDVGGVGSYELNGGLLRTGDAAVGGNGAGRLVQRGGVHQVGGTLQVGVRNGSHGRYELEGGHLEARFEFIGAEGGNPAELSAVVQTGGTHEVLEELRIGGPGTSGRLSLSGGSLRTASLDMDTAWLELVAEPGTNRLWVTGLARLGGTLRVRLAPGHTPLGGDALTLMTYGSRQGTFSAAELPPAAHGVVWSLDYLPNSLVLRAIPPPEVVLVSPLLATAQPGLFQQTVTVSNHDPEPIRGSRIYFPALPEGWQLYNASGEEEGVPYVELNTLVAPSTSVQFVVQFLVPGETRPSRQHAVVRFGAESGSGVPEPGLQFDQVVRRTDGSIQLRFTSRLNRAYRIQYSEALEIWRDVPLPLIGVGNETVWVDDGPPKTASRPDRDRGFRFYRVVEGP